MTRRVLLLDHGHALDRLHEGDRVLDLQLDVHVIDLDLHDDVHRHLIVSDEYVYQWYLLMYRVMIIEVVIDKDKADRTYSPHQPLQVHQPRQHLHHVCSSTPQTWYLWCTLDLHHRGGNVVCLVITHMYQVKCQWFQVHLLVNHKHQHSQMHPLNPQLQMTRKWRSQSRTFQRKWTYLTYCLPISDVMVHWQMLELICQLAPPMSRTFTQVCIESWRICSLYSAC